jgi:hypothetical protein
MQTLDRLEVDEALCAEVEQRAGANIHRLASLLLRYRASAELHNAEQPFVGEKSWADYFRENQIQLRQFVARARQAAGRKYLSAD